MNSIAYDIENEKTVSTKITQFFQRFHIGEILRKCNAYKEQGIPVVTVRDPVKFFVIDAV